ncbi:MAG: hypothetical protein U0P45_05290 [Acidimicrobiales bacterium]
MSSGRKPGRPKASRIRPSGGPRCWPGQAAIRTRRRVDGAARRRGGRLQGHPLRQLRRQGWAHRHAGRALRRAGRGRVRRHARPRAHPRSRWCATASPSSCASSTRTRRSTGSSSAAEGEPLVEEISAPIAAMIASVLQRQGTAEGAAVERADALANATLGTILSTTDWWSRRRTPSRKEFVALLGDYVWGGLVAGGIEPSDRPVDLATLVEAVGQTR